MSDRGPFLLFAAALLLLALVDAVRFGKRWRAGSRDRRELILGVVAIVASVNFFSFILVDFLLGGDALTGRIEDGHYYLGSHGAYTEVSHAVFIYSVCHACSALLGIAATLVTARNWKRPSSR